MWPRGYLCYILIDDGNEITSWVQMETEGNEIKSEFYHKIKGLRTEASNHKEVTNELNYHKIKGLKTEASNDKEIINELKLTKSELDDNRFEEISTNGNKKMSYKYKKIFENDKYEYPRFVKKDKADIK